MVVHSVNGRIRIRVDSIKGCRLKATRCEALLAKRRGIDCVSANPATGSVLVTYRPGEISVEQILRSLRRLRFLKARNLDEAIEEASNSPNVDLSFRRSALEGVVSSMLELTIVRLVAVLA